MHGGHRDRMVGQDHLLPQCLAESANRELRRVVGGLAGHREQSENAGDVDDVAVTGGDQVRQEGLGAVDHAPVIDVHDALDVLERRDLHVATEGDAGVVVDLVHLAELVLHLVGIQGKRLAFGDVEPVGPDRRPDRFQTCLGDRQALGVDVADGDRGAGSTQLKGQGLTNTGTRPGHDRHFAGKSLHCVPPGCRVWVRVARAFRPVTPADRPTIKRS